MHGEERRTQPTIDRAHVDVTERLDDPRRLRHHGAPIRDVFENIGKEHEVGTGVA